MTELSEFVKAVRARLGLTQDQLAEKMHVTKGNVSGWENGRHEPKFSDLRKMHNWVGGAIPLPGITDSQKLVEPSTNNPPHSGEILALKLPVFELEVVEFAHVEAYLRGDKSAVLSKTWTTEPVEDAFAINVDPADDSMSPEFEPGSTLVVSKSTIAKPGNFVLARTQTGAPLTVKQLVVDAGKTYLKPLNARYPILEAPALEIVGVIRQKISFKQYEI